MAWDNTLTIEITAGRQGVWGILNSTAVPLGGLYKLSNATLEDRMWRTGGGRSSYTIPGQAILSGRPITAGIDYWPSTTLQRQVVVDDQGHIYKSLVVAPWWVLLATPGSSVLPPMFAIGGAEASGNAKKLFFSDGQHVPQVLTADGGAMAPIATPNVDWAGANQPSWFCAHMGYMWAGGVANAPHTVYRSLATNHEDFNTTPYRLICGPLDRQRQLVGAMSYKGALLVWASPVGLYSIDTQTDTDSTHWFPARVAFTGGSGPRCMAQLGDDVLWMDPGGAWHLLSTELGQTKAPLRSDAFSFRKLGNFGVNMDLTQVGSVDMAAYPEKNMALLAYTPETGVTKSRRLEVDVSQKDTTGEQWAIWDRDDNRALFMIQYGGQQKPAMGDSSGFVHLLDFPVRAIANTDGSLTGYQFEWWLRDSDLSEIIPNAGGRKKNLKFVQLVYAAPHLQAAAAVTHVVEARVDGGVVKSTATFPLTATTSTVGLNTTPRKRLVGRGTRLSLRGYTGVYTPVTDAGLTNLNVDVAIAKVILGVELGP